MQEYLIDGQPGPPEPRKPSRYLLALPVSVIDTAARFDIRNPAEVRAWALEAYIT